jgi:hypothetical protein
LNSVEVIDENEKMISKETFILSEALNTTNFKYKANRIS